MRNIIDKIAKALGYVRAESLTTENRNLGWALAAVKDDLSRLQNRNARLEAKCQEISAQAKRLQREADELLTAKANQIRYGIPIGQAFRAHVSKYKDIERDSYHYRIDIKPSREVVSLVINPWALEDLKEQPEAYARKIVREELVPQLELGIARALRAGADEAVLWGGSFVPRPQPLADSFGR